MGLWIVGAGVLAVVLWAVRRDRRLAREASSNPGRAMPASQPSSSLPWAARLVVIGTAVLLLFWLAGRNQDTKPSTPHSATGCSASKRAIEARLKAPGSAKWVDCHSITRDGVQTVRLIVDSHNSFGALIRSQWVTKVSDNQVLEVVQVQ